MHPPAGRLQIGDQVTTRDGRKGRLVGEELIATNGAWKYTVAFDGGGSGEHLDYELRRLEPAA
ncbi:MAG TPA: hypothetical protein VGR62_17135 [Candidatus Binatia bacterium]|jgi:hypothetical protein|nr:hypothetical protein [Candidatus Binatia bacterium]